MTETSAPQVCGGWFEVSLLLGRSLELADVIMQRRLIPVLREWNRQGVHKRCLP